MKKLLFILVLITAIFVTVIYAADTKTTGLAELTAVDDADIMYIVDAGTSKKITVVNLFDTIDTSLKLLTILTNETGTGALVFATSPTLVTPALGTITSGVGTALTALDGENIQDDTIDDDSIDWSDVTFADFDFETNWKMWYSDGSGDVTELTLGANGTFLESNGAAAAPAFRTLVDGDILDNITIDLATLATTLTITDNESTAENNPVVFVAGAAQTGGSLGLETDGDFYYTPNTGTVTATEFVGGGSGLTLASTDLTDTADLLYEAELDVFSELDTQIADKALVNFEDGGTFTGNIIANGNLSVGNATTTAGVLTLLEDDDDGSNFASFTVPALGANTVYILPPDDGDNTEVLQTDGSGTLTWVANAGGGATAWDDISDPDNSGLTTITFDNAEATLFTGDNDAVVSFFTIQNSDADHTVGSMYLLDLDYSGDDGDPEADFIKFQDSGSVVMTIQQNGDITTDGGLIAGGAITEGGNAVPNATDNLGFFGGTSSAELYGELSDETGSAAGTPLAVFNVAPVFTTSIQLTGADANPAAAAGTIVYDNTIAGLSGGALRWYDNDSVRVIVDLETDPSNDDYVVTYDADADGFYMKADADTGGSTKWNAIGDADGVGSIDFATYTQTIDIGKSDSGGGSGLVLDVTGLGAGTDDVIALEITTVANGDTDYIPIAVYNDSGTANNLVFQVNGLGTVSANQITLSEASFINNWVQYEITFGGNGDELEMFFTGTDVELRWSDGVLNLRNKEDGIDGIVNIQGKDGGEKGILRVMSDGDDKYIELYHDDTDAQIVSSSGDLYLTAVGGDINLGDDNLTTTGTATFAGGTLTGNIDISGGDLEIPQATPAVPDADGEIEFDFTDGSLVIQHGSAHAELGSPTDVVVGKLIRCWGGTIYEPDNVNDVMTVKAINSIEFPHGVVITAIYLGVSENTSYTLTVQNFDDFDTINSGNPTIDAVAYTADTTGEIIDSSPTYDTIAAGQLIMISIPATDVDWIHFEIYYYEPAA